MAHKSRQKIDNALAAMEAVLERAPEGGGDHVEALLDFRCRCWELMLLVVDRDCQAYIDSLVQYAKELYSGRDHGHSSALRARLRALLAEFRLANSRAAS